LRALGFGQRVTALAWYNLFERGTRLAIIASSGHKKAPPEGEARTMD
jgi:hypothetical protein